MVEYASREVVASYCATFLPREMLHVYRQVTGLQSFESVVITRTRRNEAQFPHPRVKVLGKGPLRGLSRAWNRIRGRPVPLSGREVRQALAACEAAGARVLHVYLGSEAVRALRLLESFQGARIVSFHGADLSNAHSPQSYSALWERAERFLCRSESLKRRLVELGCPADRIRLNYTGVPMPEANRAPERVCPRWRDGEPVRLLQVCRLIPKKGLDVSLRALRHLRDRGVPARLAIAGDGPLEGELRTLAAQLSISEHVDLMGFLTGSPLADALSGSHVFVHPSRDTDAGEREGIPNSMLEAMACGLPVVATRHSGIPEAIMHGVSGLLVESDDAAAVADAVARTVSSSELYGEMSRGGWEVVRDRFSIPRCIERLESCYLEAMAARS